MKWLFFGLVGGVVAWLEYDYQCARTRRAVAVFPVPESAHVERLGDAPSISPGAENDKKLNSTT